MIRCKFLWTAISLHVGLMASACGSEATYQLVFDSPWSNSTHPGNYPSSAHFSSLIGGTHNGGVSFWELGGIATQAIETMAETGGSNQLRNQVQAAIGDGTAAAVVSASGIAAPGSRTLTLNVTPEHPLLTLVTMVAPSPDWFVGTSGLDLRVAGQWVDSLVLDLVTYDAGTDSGVDFTSPNADVTPHEPISILGAPLDGQPVLGTFTLTLLSTTGGLCDFDSNGSCDVADLNQLLAVGPIAAGFAVDYGTNDKFDLNGDGIINLVDRDDWLTGAAAENGLASPYLLGDANLDGTVDGQDYVAWNISKFTASLEWGVGDFNGDGLVDGQDFLIWNTNKFLSSDVNSVPEPNATLLLLLCAASWAARAAARPIVTVT